MYLFWIYATHRGTQSHTRTHEHTHTQIQTHIYYLPRLRAKPTHSCINLSVLNGPSSKLN